MANEPLIDGRFVLLEHAASGGMGSVYRARDVTSSRIVAVKLLGRDEPIDVIRFAREAQLLATVHHPNVVAYIAHGANYLAQDWIDGATLAKQQHSSGITAREAVAVAIGVASALDAMHALGVIHRDVKPANIILEANDPARIKLVDFGIARLTMESGTLTRAGAVLGTPSYMSPEQARGLTEITPETDVWALGCVLHEALTGRVTFAGRSPTAIRAKVLLAVPSAIAPGCPEASTQLVELVTDLLRKDPRDRPSSGEVLARLRALEPIADGPRRTVGVAQPRTVVVGPRRLGTSFVLVTGIEDSTADTTAHFELIAKVAERHGLELNRFDDGSVLLGSIQSDRAGAIAAANAGLALRNEIFDGGICVFGQGLADDAVDDAIDRGSELLERSALGTLFDAVPRVLIDDVIAELVADALPIEHTDAGPALRAKRH